MGRLTWTPAAEHDLEAIFLYIGREFRRPSTAARVLRQIADKAGMHAAEPLLGNPRPECGNDVRYFTCQSYVVFYRPTSQGIEVLRVIHGARDVCRVFLRDEL